MSTKKSLKISVGGQSDDSQVLQPFSLTGYDEKEWADHLRIGTTFNCFTSQSGPHLALENIQTKRISSSKVICMKVESLDSIMSAYKLSPSAAGRFLKLLSIDLSYTTDNSTSSTEKKNHFLYSHIIQKKRQYLKRTPDTRNATESGTHYVDSVAYGGYLFVHLTSKNDIGVTRAENVIKSDISLMDRQAGLDASTKKHSDSTERKQSYHIISSIPFNVFSKEEDIVERFVSTYNQEKPDLTPITFHFVALPGAKLKPYFKFSKRKFELISRDVDEMKQKMELFISSVPDLETKKMLQSHLSSIQELSDDLTELEKNFHVKEDFVGIDPKKVLKDYNLLLKQFRKDIKFNVGKDVGELSTLQAYFKELESCRREKWSSDSCAFRKSYSGFPNYGEYGNNLTPWNSLSIATFSIHKRSSQSFWDLLLNLNSNGEADSKNPYRFFDSNQSGVKEFLPAADLMIKEGPSYANLILVFDGSEERLSSDDTRFIDQFKVRFGHGVCKKTCLVLLNADKMLKEQTMTGYMNNGTNKTLKQLAIDFDWRILGFPSDARETYPKKFLQQELTSILSKCDEPYKPTGLAALSWRLYSVYYYCCKVCCSYSS